MKILEFRFWTSSRSFTIFLNSHQLTSWKVNITLRVAAVQIALHNFFYDRTEISILLLKATLILREEPVERMEEDPAEDCALWMSGTIDSCHDK